MKLFLIFSLLFSSVAFAKKKEVINLNNNFASKEELLNKVFRYTRTASSAEKVYIRYNYNSLEKICVVYEPTPVPPRGPSDRCVVWDWRNRLAHQHVALDFRKAGELAETETDVIELTFAQKSLYHSPKALTPQVISSRYEYEIKKPWSIFYGVADAYKFIQ